MPELKKLPLTVYRDILGQYIRYYPDVQSTQSLKHLAETHGFNTEPLYWVDPEVDVTVQDMQGILEDRALELTPEEKRTYLARYQQQKR